MYHLLPTLKQYSWDEPGIPYFSLKEKNEDYKPLFPPEGMDLSPAWAMTIIKLDLSGIECHARYPIVFTTKSLNPSYVIKEQVTKTIIAADNI